MVRYIWQSLSAAKYSQEEIETAERLQIQAVDCCRRVWDTVRAVLCDDSPEGHLPEDLEEVDGLDTKDLLSYSFRAIHESRYVFTNSTICESRLTSNSHLLRVVASNARSRSGAGLIKPPQDLFEIIGNLTFEQLSNLRHRGAFTTVSQTFTGCCQLVKCYAPAANQQESLLDQWYKVPNHGVTIFRVLLTKTGGIALHLYAGVDYEKIGRYSSTHRGHTFLQRRTAFIPRNYDSAPGNCSEAGSYLGNRRLELATGPCAQLHQGHIQELISQQTSRAVPNRLPTASCEQFKVGGVRVDILVYGAHRLIAF
jgi:hypothetical protein